MKYRNVGKFVNDTKEPITLWLEPNCEEIVMNPGHEIELFTEDNDEYYPVSFMYHTNGIQIYPNGGPPKWLIKFKNKEIVPGYPTKLSDHD